MVLFTIVLWIHIFGAIAWLGAAMVFGMIIGPGLAKVSPQSRADFVVNVVPKYTRYTLIFAIATLVFGIGSLITLPTTGSPSSYGNLIYIGALLALVAFGIGVGVTIPAANKTVKIIKSMAGNPGPPPPELKAASERMRIGATVAMVVLILVSILMVAGATL